MIRLAGSDSLVARVESDGDVALRECSAIEPAKKAESTHLELVELVADLLDGALGESEAVLTPSRDANAPCSPCAFGPPTSQ
jgi:hypothetical protein